MTVAAKSKISNSLSIIIRVGIAIGLLVLLSFVLDFRKLFLIIKSASWWMLAIAAIAILIDDMLTVFKWRLLLTGLSLTVPFPGLFKLYLEGRFLSFFFPSAVTADLYKGIFLSREVRSGIDVASSIVLERLTGITSTAIISVLAVCFLPGVFSGVGVIVTMIVIAVVVILGFLSFLYADHIGKVVLNKLTKPPARISDYLERIVAGFASYRHHNQLLIIVFLLSFIILFIRCLSVWLIALSLNDHTAPVFFVLFIPYIFMLNMIPFIGSRIGSEQGMFVILFGAIGMDNAVAFAISILAVFLGLIVAFPGGFWLLTKSKFKGRIFQSG